MSEGKACDKIKLVSSIEKGLREYSPSHDIAFKIMSFLHMVSFNSPEYQAALGKSSVTALVVNTFKNPSLSPDVCDQGLCALQNITYNNGRP